MKAMFANLTRADFGLRPGKHSRAARRLRVHRLFDEIQIAIYTGDLTRVDQLLVKLALATTGRARAN